MNNNKGSLFTRLTRLFRSGPVIRRRVRDFSQPSASSALEVFRKAHSDVYNSTLSAYGSFDRMCVDLDTLIPIPGKDGFISLREAIEKYPNGEKFLVYAYDHDKKCVVPAWANHPRSSGVRETVKITFDDGSELVCTPDHPCMMRDGTFKDAGDLVPDESMMPFYRKQFPTKKNNRDLSKYRNVFTMAEGSWRGWQPEHVLIATMTEGRKIEKGEHVHHVDFNPENNVPANLQVMSAFDHLSMHGRLAAKARSPQARKKVSDAQKRNWKNNPKRKEALVEFNKSGRVRALRSEHAKNNNPTKDPKVRQKISRAAAKRYQDPKARSKQAIATKKAHAEGRLNTSENFSAYWKGKTRSVEWKESRTGVNHHAYVKIKEADLINAVKEHRLRKDVAAALGTSPNTVLRRAKDIWDVKTWSDVIAYAFNNHKIASVVPWKTIETGDLTVDDYENFATSTIFVHNSRYSDFSEMEATPEIGSALDIYAEETCSSDDKGKVLHIYSENNRIQEILEELFYDVLNVDFNLTMWIRNLVKYGDFFIFNDISPEFGVINAYPIAISEIEREEGFDAEDPMAVRFRWITQGNTVLENWQVSHFRLLGNDAFLPYGSSVLESARRIWRQLILMEDAMLVYRVIRAPERRVFYIDVGNIPPDEIPNYMEQATTSLKRQPAIDKSTGKMDLRYNPYPVWRKSPIPLLDGRTITIEELAKEYDAGKDNWVYSVQDETQQLVPGKVTWCGKNYEADKMIKVWLDDDTWVMTAPEHPFVMRDGSSKRADELELGNSLMPLYRDVNNKGYERCYNPLSQKYETTHTLVAKSCYANQWDHEKRPVVHHKEPWLRETNKRNNHPDNLDVMDFWAHRKWHIDHIQHTLLHPDNLARARVDMIRYNKSPEKRAKTTRQNIERDSVSAMKWYNGSDLHKEHNEIRRVAQLDSWSKNKETRSQAMKISLPPGCVKIAIDELQKNPTHNRDRLFEAVKLRDDFRTCWEQTNSHNNRSFNRYNMRTFVDQLNEKGYGKFADFKKFAVSGQKNHKVSRIEEIFDRDDVYCMTVVGPNGEEDRHNFAMQSFEKNGDVSQDGIFVLNSVDEDYFLPVRGSEGGTKIETLAGGTNASAIEDVQYIQKKLFAALKIPRAYLGYDEDVGAKATLAQEDIRFSRTIARIQKTVIAELNKLAMIHLYCHGFDEEEIADFDLKLTNPSSIAQQQKLELIRTQFEIAGSVPEGVVDRQWIRRNVLGLTPDKIEQIKEGRKADKLEDADVEAAGAEEGGAEEAGEEMGGEDDLFSGDRPEGQLLTARPGSGNSYAPDDEEDEEDLLDQFSMDDENAPDKAEKRLQNAFGGPIKADRKVRNGPLGSQMPDLGKMVGIGSSARAQDTSNKPYDEDFLFGTFSEAEDHRSTRRPRITSSLEKMFASMGTAISSNKKTLLSESEAMLDEDITSGEEP